MTSQIYDVQYILTRLRQQTGMENINRLSIEASKGYLQTGDPYQTLQNTTSDRALH